MKLISVEISNIGAIEHIKFEINKPLIMFFGEPRQGKTTILDSIILAAGGSFSNDILRHGTTEGFVEDVFSNGLIRREFYIGKDGTVKARKVKCVMDGRPIDKPSEILKQLNPFLLDHDFFIKKSSLEKQRYFIELLDINTEEHQKNIKDIDRISSDLRAEIKGYGEIDCTPVEKIDIDALKEEKHRIENVYELERIKINQQNIEIQKSNELFDKNIRNYEENIAKIEDLKKQINWLKNKIYDIDKINDELLFKRKKLFKQAFIDLPQKPDTTDIAEQIAQAYAQEVRREQYLKNMIKVKERENKKKKLSCLEQQKKNEEKELMMQLATIAESSGIPGLRFDENAQAIFQDTALDMLSGAQKLELSSLLFSKYPKDFGIELLDRGESIFAGRDRWKRVQEFIDRAEKEEITILTTVVGEEPSDIPENIGVYVVEEGKLK